MDKDVDLVGNYLRKCRLGKARFVPAKRTAIDGKVWWCVYDKTDNKYVPGMKKMLRREIVLSIVMAMKHGYLPSDEK